MGGHINVNVKDVLMSQFTVKPLFIGLTGGKDKQGTGKSGVDFMNCKTPPINILKKEGVQSHEQFIIIDSTHTQYISRTM